MKCIKEFLEPNWWKAIILVLLIELVFLSFVFEEANPKVGILYLVSLIILVGPSSILMVLTNSSSFLGYLTFWLGFFLLAIVYYIISCLVYFIAKQTKSHFYKKEISKTAKRMAIVIFVMFSIFLFLFFWQNMPEPRPSRWDAHFKAMCSSFVPVAVLCCDTKGEITTNIGKDLCDPVLSDVNWPNEKEISSINIIKNCQEDGSFEFLVTPPERLSGSSKCISATCKETGCTFKGCY